MKTVIEKMYSLSKSVLKDLPRLSNQELLIEEKNWKRMARVFPTSDLAYRFVRRVELEKARRARTRRPRKPKGLNERMDQLAGAMGVFRTARILGAL